MSIGIKAFTSSQKLAFSSDYPMLKVFRSGQINASSAGTYNISHNLGYPPAFIVTGYGPSGTGSGQRNLANYANQGGEKISVSSDGTNLNISLSGTWTGVIFYYIFLDPAK